MPGPDAKYIQFLIEVYSPQIPQGQLHVVQWFEENEFRSVFDMAWQAAKEAIDKQLESVIKKEA